MGQPVVQPDQPELQPDETELQPDLAELQPDEPELQPNQPELLAHLAFILSYESELLAHLTILQPNQPVVFAHEPELQPGQPELLTHVSLVQPHPRMTDTRQHIRSTRLLMTSTSVAVGLAVGQHSSSVGVSASAARCVSGRMTQMHTSPGSHLFPEPLACGMVGTRQACVRCSVVCDCVASRARIHVSRVCVFIRTRT